MYLNMGYVYVSSYVIVMHLIFGVRCSLYKNMGWQEWNAHGMA